MGLRVWGLGLGRKNLQHPLLMTVPGAPSAYSSGDSPFVSGLGFRVLGLRFKGLGSSGGYSLLICSHRWDCRS